MKNFLIKILLILVAPVVANASNTVLYSCKIEDSWLKEQNIVGNLIVYKDLERAEIKLKGADEEVSCPLIVESLQDASRAVVATANFKFSAQSCAPESKNFNKHLRAKMTLKVSTQPGVPPEAVLAWRAHTGFSACHETENNLQSVGVGSRLPQSTPPKKRK